MKETHPSKWMDNHIKVHSFFNESSILIPPAISPIVVPDALVESDKIILV